MLRALRMNPTRIAFIACLAFSSLAESATVTRGPYLQNATPTSVVIRWRTDVATDSRVTYGQDPGILTTGKSDATASTEHAITLTDLTPGETYYYSVGSSGSAHVSGADCF